MANRMSAGGVTILTRGGRRKAVLRGVAGGIEVRFARAAGWRDNRDGTKDTMWAWEEGGVIDAPFSRVADHVERVLNEGEGNG